MSSNRIEIKKSKINRPFKKRIGILFILLLFGVISILAIRISIMPVNIVNVGEITVVVPQNTNTAQIADLLADKGVIRSPLVFRLYARINNLDGSLKPGRYTLNTEMSVSKIIEELRKGPPDRIQVTIPEGYTVAQIADMLDQKGITDRESFFKALSQKKDYPFLDGIDIDRWGLDGYLYPDTYYLGSNTNADKIIDMMLLRFNQLITAHDYVNKALAKGLTLNEAVTIASMVEREARVESERARIAGVIFNRLKLGMPLQIDATVQYALGKPKENLLYKDLEINSPYNTYKISGLPPGPIANPGWPSLQAVVEAEENEYLYYVAKPDGTHAFARTLADHNNNIKKYQ